LKYHARQILEEDERAQQSEMARRSEMREARDPEGMDPAAKAKEVEASR
jgi:hypothetical protein